MKKIRNIIFALIVILSLVAISSCRHGWHGKGYHGHPDRMVEKIAADLDLNDAQKTKLIDFKDELAGKKDEMRAGHSKVKEAFIDELKSNSFNEERIKEIIDREQAMIDEIIDLFVDRLGEFHAVLTAEQRVKLAAKVDKMKGRKHGWHGCEK
ncbi:MAG: Spy/CpxP family protein refolding chaperone [Proteobacteria bacterium]|nr:Spy/CpxP family protein refolding chaperone [Pseudomonadota bacterium]